MRSMLFAVFILFSLPGISNENEQRIRQLEEKLRCLVCQNQSLADSNAELAGDLRKQVRDQVAAGRSDEEIVGYLVQRYGDFVLYRPPLKATTVVLWAGPFALIALGVLVFFRVVRRRREGGQPATPDQREAVRKLLETD